MEYHFRPVMAGDSPAILSIFNHYVEASYAAYFEDRVDESFFTTLSHMTSGYPFYVIEMPEAQIAGFGLLHRYHPARAFKRTAELSYFISPSLTRRGLGTKIAEPPHPRSQPNGH
ncbi:MAG: hypothetical protein IBX68_12230 [Dehalococcoidia bacterium]|nr:hypothetical protein [Dehalococcoidia bacterium]